MKQQLLEAVKLHPTQRFSYLANEGITILSFLDIIGDSDSQLRDELAFRIFVEALYYNAFTKEELTTLTMTLITDDYLYYEVKSTNPLAVFKRSFSALWLSYLINADRGNTFLSDEQLNEVFTSVSSYLNVEKDVRGLTADFGWANAVAHGGDMYLAVVQHPKFETRFAPTILQSMTASLWQGEVFIDDQEQKLAKVLKLLAKIDYPEDVLIEWVEQLDDRLNHYVQYNGYTRLYFQSKTNTTHLLQALYFQLKFGKVYEKLQATASFFISKGME
jgi:hypothetical protein